MKIAFLFPGQGSQSVGMGADLYAKYPSAAKLMDEFDERIGYKLSTLCFYGPDDRLRATSVTQPALFAVSMAALKVLTERGIVAQAVAGHSVGEYAALVGAGAIEVADALALVYRRGEIMHRASESAPGSMAAVLGLDAEVVRRICAETEAAGRGTVDVANVNGAGQVVISGEPLAVEDASELAKSRGAARVISLPVAGAYHSRLMAGAALELKPFIDTARLEDAKLPVVANVTGRYERSAAEIRANLEAQIEGSVLWEQSINLLLADGFDSFVEVGAGSVLGRILKRTSNDVAIYNTSDSSALEAAAAALRS